MAGSVLDASALLAYLRDEPGAGRVQDALLSGSEISAVNWAETLTKLADIGQDPESTAARLRDEGLLGQLLAIVPFDEAGALETGRLRRATRHLKLSLGDRACLALGRARGLPVLTTDRRWRSLAVKVKVKVIVLR